MTPQELQKLRGQISASTLLSQIEKAEWIQLLPEMNDAQALELSSILDTAAERAKNTPILKPNPVQKKSPEPEEKELPAGAELAELQEEIVAAQLPEHASHQVKQVQVAVQMPVAAPKQATPPVQLPKINPVTPAPTSKHHQIDLKNPEDLAKLDISFLRQSDPELVLNNLLHSFAEMTKHYPITELIGKIETSPLYKAYYATGLTALNSGVLSEQTQPNILSKKEFEIFTDFRREMEQIIS